LNPDISFGRRGRYTCANSTSKQYINLAIAIHKFFIARTYPAQTTIRSTLMECNLFFPFQMPNVLPMVYPNHHSKTVQDKIAWDHQDKYLHPAPNIVYSKLNVNQTHKGKILNLVPFGK
jgi:hypothetical protein